MISNTERIDTNKEFLAWLNSLGDVQEWDNASLSDAEYAALNLSPSIVPGFAPTPGGAFAAAFNQSLAALLRSGSGGPGGSSVAAQGLGSSNGSAGNGELLEVVVTGHLDGSPGTVSFPRTLFSSFPNLEAGFFSGIWGPGVAIASAWNGGLRQFRNQAIIAGGAEIVGAGIGAAIAARSAARGAAAAVEESTTVYRVFGGEARGLGRSWTTVNPGNVANYREAAGLFPGNSGQFIVEGQLTNTEGVLLRDALPGPNGVGGGLPELVIPNPGSQVCILCVSGVNPPF